MTRVHGYAYVGKDRIPIVETVSGTEIGSMVNAIFYLSSGHIRPQSCWPDEQIRDAFSVIAEGRGLVSPVIVSVAEH